MSSAVVFYFLLCHLNSGTSCAWVWTVVFSHWEAAWRGLVIWRYHLMLIHTFMVFKVLSLLPLPMSPYPNDSGLCSVSFLPEGTDLDYFLIKSYEVVCQEAKWGGRMIWSVWCWCTHPWSNPITSVVYMYCAYKLFFVSFFFYKKGCTRVHPCPLLGLPLSSKVSTQTLT